jgi:hypothetical protein
VTQGAPARATAAMGRRVGLALFGSPDERATETRQLAGKRVVIPNPASGAPFLVGRRGERDRRDGKCEDSCRPRTPGIKDAVETIQASCRCRFSMSKRDACSTCAIRVLFDEQAGRLLYLRDTGEQAGRGRDTGEQAGRLLYMGAE